MKYDNLLQAIGQTPHLRLSRLFPNHEVWIKLEKNNPAGSIKDRVALAMVEQAILMGDLQKGGTIIEPTSGNTGIGLAMVAALKGFELLIVMPDTMSIERQKQLRALGAKVILTPGDLGMQGAIAQANELYEQIPGAWIPQQFENPANVRIHQQTTAREILEDFPDGFDYFVSGVGTGGHLTGVGLGLKARNPQMKIIAVEPKESAVLSGSNAATHGIQGIGAGFIPKNLNLELVDQIQQISTQKAYKYVSLAALKEGLLVGISTGAVLAAIDQILDQVPFSSKVITLNYDSSDRYTSLEELY